MKKKSRFFIGCFQWIYYFCGIKQLNRRIMAMSIKSIPVLKGQDATKFVAEADNNKNQATPALSEKAAERLKKVLEKSKAFTF
jgi:hypothetical protein